MDEEHKRKISESRLKGSYRGSKSARYKPFKIVYACPNEDCKEYIFDGDHPSRECWDALGIQYSTQSKMKNGEQWVIKSIKPSSRHPFKKGSTITIELLKH